MNEQPWGYEELQAAVQQSGLDWMERVGSDGKTACVVVSGDGLRGPIVFKKCAKLPKRVVEYVRDQLERED